MLIALTITPASVEVTPIIRSAKILFRLLPGRYEKRKGFKPPGRLSNADCRLRNRANVEI